MLLKCDFYFYLGTKAVTRASESRSLMLVNGTTVL